MKFFFDFLIGYLVAGVAVSLLVDIFFSKLNSHNRENEEPEIDYTTQERLIVIFFWPLVLIKIVS